MYIYIRRCVCVHKCMRVWGNQKKLKTCCLLFWDIVGVVDVTINYIYILQRITALYCSLNVCVIVCIYLNF